MIKLIGGFNSYRIVNTASDLTKLIISRIYREKKHNNMFSIRDNNMFLRKTLSRNKLLFYHNKFVQIYINMNNIISLRC